MEARFSKFTGQKNLTIISFFKKFLKSTVIVSVVEMWMTQ